MNIAILGAGLSGTVLYDRLSKVHDVTLFEKSRGAGGRCSTRYIKDKKIDHGTPYFEANNKDFVRFCEQAVSKDILYKKQAQYYPSNGLNALCSSFIHNDDLVRNTKIVSASRRNNKWSLKDIHNNTFAGFDLFLITIPAPQVLELECDLDNTTIESLQKVTYDSIATLLIYAWHESDLLNKEIMQSDFFFKVIDNSLKYGYKDFSSYVFHANKDFSNKSSSKDEILQTLVDEVEVLSKTSLSQDFYTISHLWKYAFVSKECEGGSIYEPENNLGLCGDYFGTKNLQSAFESAHDLLKKLP